MNIDHSEERMHRVLGITDKRLYEMTGIVKDIMEKSHSPSEYLEKVWTNTDLCEEEKVFLTYTANEMSQHDLGKDAHIASVGAHSALSLFLGSVQAWGLEHALDEIRKVTKPEWKETSYRGCLIAVEKVSELVKGMKLED